ncbi:epoxide hydrolase family protein [Sphingopyxis sp. 22461]|uniref:epoxide hydrolase family protein n=1 Tax=Sphingopyxis sp. 22461 TaxID=3453923 RepID=UPI003F83EF43
MSISKIDHAAVRPFRLSVSEDELADLRERLARTRWQEREPVDDWSQGARLEKLRSLCEYWRTVYDWRRCEEQLNAWGQFKTDLDGLDIHFLHIRSPHANALPMLMTHGWPGSVIEFNKVIGPLTNPVAYGGNPEDAFHLVLPSLPGYGFSGKPSCVGWGVERIARNWAVLMARLGYDRYVAQGGDWGAAVTNQMGVDRAEGCAAIHLNIPIVYPTPEQMAAMTQAEEAAVKDWADIEATGTGYLRIQSTRPQTLGYGLTDSPVGQAAWIYEKLQFWTDHDGAVEDLLGMDEMLDNIMLYWLPATGGSSARLYWESIANAFQTRSVEMPVGVSIFPKELSRPSRRWAENAYSALFYWNELDKGGHFAAFEQPELFVDEMRRCFRVVR